MIAQVCNFILKYGETYKELKFSVQVFEMLFRIWLLSTVSGEVNLILILCSF